MGEQLSIDKFMKWLVNEKWNLLNPVRTRTLYTEFSEVSGNETPYEKNMYNIVQSKLKAAKLDQFTIPQMAHIAFLLSIPLDEKLRTLMETCGELVVDPDGHRINYFKTFDGNTWTGTHRKWKGKSKRVAEEVDVVLPKKGKWTHEQEEKEKDEEMRKQNLQFQKRVEKAREIQKRREEKEKERLEIMNGELAHVNFAEEMKMELKERNGEMDVKRRDFETFDQDFKEGFPRDFAHEVGKPDAHLHPEAVQQLNIHQGKIENKNSHHQQLSAPNHPMAPVDSQTTPVPSISAAQFFKALKKIAFTCELDDVMETIKNTEKKPGYQNLNIPTMEIVMSITCILKGIQDLSKESEKPSGPQIPADLYLSSMNSAVLTLGHMEPVIKMIEKTMGLARSKKMNVSIEKVCKDFEALLEVAGSSV